MVKILAIVATLAAAVAPVAADNCLPGIYYCGFVLDARDEKYGPLIAKSLLDHNQHLTPERVRNSLFFCDIDASGDIDYIAFCRNGCINGGSGKNDYCRKRPLDDLESANMSDLR